MPVTSSPINACNTVLLLKNASGAMVDISGMANNVKLDLNKTIGEFKVFGSPDMWRLQCGRDASLELSIVYSRDVDGAFDILRDWHFSGSGARTIQINLPDNAVGSDRYEGDYLLESMSMPLAADEAAPIMVSATLKPNGPVTYSVVTTT